MKTHPILFSAPMVRALLDGGKTQTRRAMNPQPEFVHEPADWQMQVGGRLVAGRGSEWLHWQKSRVSQENDPGCPYGQPGDQLWVRETWSSDFAKHYPHDRVWYAADDNRENDIAVRNGVRGIFSPESQEHVPFRWHPSIHMFRTDSRITLEIVSVRVERLQDISEADAVAEGISEDGPACDRCGGAGAYIQGGDCVMCEAPGCGDGAVDEYRALWKKINGPGSWDANPWVWAVEFKRVAQNNKQEAT